MYCVCIAIVSCIIGKCMNAWMIAVIVRMKSGLKVWVNMLKLVNVVEGHFFLSLKQWENDFILWSWLLWNLKSAYFSKNFQVLTKEEAAGRQSRSKILLWLLSPIWRHQPTTQCSIFPSYPRYVIILTFLLLAVCYLFYLEFSVSVFTSLFLFSALYSQW